MEDKRYLIFISIGIELLVFMLIGLWLGKKADEFFQFNGIFMLTGSLLALVSWFIHLIQLIKKLEEPSAKTLLKDPKKEKKSEKKN